MSSTERKGGEKKVWRVGENSFSTGENRGKIKNNQYASKKALFGKIFTCGEVGNRLLPSAPGTDAIE